MPGATVVLAGASGDLGERVARALVARGATVRALTRPDAEAMRSACAGADCVVSTLSGLRPVIVDAQTQLLQAAVAAAVPRFIPSDYSIDYTAIPAGSNRNLDLRREFMERLNGAPIAGTSVLNGAFADMLTGTAPLILFNRRRVLYWHDADQEMDFTTMDDAAAFTADAALDAGAPRFLRVAGDQVSAATWPGS